MHPESFIGVDNNQGRADQGEFCEDPGADEGERGAQGDLSPVGSFLS
jgi:hypothetical protein